jgi:GT2 family glycosyltransferase
VSRLAAVVVAWNGGEALERCVASLLGQGIFRLVLVDNHSHPAEQSRLEKLYGSTPDIELLRLGENRGFAGGGNVGLEHALEAGADAILVVTQDVVVAPGAVGILAAALRDCDAGIAGPLVIDERSGAELSRGERLVPELICLPRTLLRPRQGGVEAREVDGVMGCLMLLSAACARATGGFDPAFFAYYEEVDLCLRARAAGFRIVCAPAARITHDGLRGFLGGFTPLAAELKARNLVWLMRKHGTALRWATFLPTYFLLLLSSALLYLVRGRGEIAAALGRGAVAGLSHGPAPGGAVH